MELPLPSSAQSKSPFICQVHFTYLWITHTITDVWDLPPFSTLLPFLPSQPLWNMIINNKGISAEIWKQFVGGDVPSIAF